MCPDSEQSANLDKSEDHKGLITIDLAPELNDTGRKVLELYILNPRMTDVEIAQICGISQPAVYKYKHNPKWLAAYKRLCVNKLRHKMPAVLDNLADIASTSDYHGSNDRKLFAQIVGLLEPEYTGETSLKITIEHAGQAINTFIDVLVQDNQLEESGELAEFEIIEPETDPKQPLNNPETTPQKDSKDSETDAKQHLNSDETDEI